MIRRGRDETKEREERYEQKGTHPSIVLKALPKGGKNGKGRNKGSLMRWLTVYKQRMQRHVKLIKPCGVLPTLCIIAASTKVILAQAHKHTQKSATLNQ